MSEIKFKLDENGEPVCQHECPSCETATNWETKSTCLITEQFVLEYGDFDDPCIPGLRQQRDEARREICEVDPRITRSVAEVARLRGWGYLYEKGGQ